MDENRLLLSRLDDLVAGFYDGKTEGLGFLNELEVSVAHNYLSNLGVEHCFYGGYSGATRMFLYISDSPVREDISTLKIAHGGGVSLSHRDYLGSLMGLGIVRECIGDIIIKENYAVAFVRSEISDYVFNNLSSVGRTKVSVCKYDGDLSNLASAFTEVEVLLSSMRIDNFVASVCKCSRQQAVERINSDCVYVNYSCNLKPSKALAFGDTVSIRGFGKFKIGEILRFTKSGRQVLSVKQYK